MKKVKMRDLQQLNCIGIMEMIEELQFDAAISVLEQLNFSDAMADAFLEESAQDIFLNTEEISEMLQDMLKRNIFLAGKTLGVKKAFTKEGIEMKGCVKVPCLEKTEHYPFIPKGFFED